MATTSLGSSTTHSTSPVRRASRQIRHCSDSATLKHVWQNLTRSLTRCNAVARRLTSVASADRMWNAMRCALFGPTPGSRPSSSIRSWMAPSYTLYLHSGQTEATGERTHLRLGEVAGLLGGVVQSRDHEVFERLHVLRIDGLGVDLDGDDVAGAGHRHRDQPAAGRAGELGLGQLLLGSGHLLLHLLRLPHQVLQAGLSTGEHGVLLRVDLRRA